MANLENDIEINCPYCSAAFSVRIDMTAGNYQAFIIDCENCCRPMEVEADVEPDGFVNIVVKREGEG